MTWESLTLKVILNDLFKGGLFGFYFKDLSKEVQWKVVSVPLSVCLPSISSEISKSGTWQTPFVMIWSSRGHCHKQTARSNININIFLFTLDMIFYYYYFFFLKHKIMENRLAVPDRQGDTISTSSNQVYCTCCIMSEMSQEKLKLLLFQNVGGLPIVKRCSSSERVLLFSENGYRLLRKILSALENSVCLSAPLQVVYALSPSSSAVFSAASDSPRKKNR